jgi:hypothetical protein
MSSYVKNVDGRRLRPGNGVRRGGEYLNIKEIT